MTAGRRSTGSKRAIIAACDSSSSRWSSRVADRNPGRVPTTVTPRESCARPSAIIAKAVTMTSRRACRGARRSRCDHRRCGARRGHARSALASRRRHVITTRKKPACSRQLATRRRPMRALPPTQAGRSARCSTASRPRLPIACSRVTRAAGAIAVRRRSTGSNSLLGAARPKVGVIEKVGPQHRPRPPVMIAVGVEHAVLR